MSKIIAILKTTLVTVTAISTIGLLVAWSDTQSSLSPQPQVSDCVFETNVNVVKSLFQKHVIPSTMGPLMMNIGIGPDVDILNFRRDATFGTKVTSDRVDCETLLEADPVGAFLKREGVTDPARIKEAKERFPFGRADDRGG
jgi:hypothetical protein